MMKDNLKPISVLNFLRLNMMNLAAPLGFSFSAFLLSFVLNYLMTQVTDTEIYGDTMLSLTWIGITGSLVILGIDQSSRRFVTSFLSEANLDHVHHFIRWGLKFIRKSCALSLILGLICFVIFDPLRIHAFEPFVVSHSTWSGFYAFIFIITPIVGLTNWMASLLICYKKTAASTFVQYLNVPIFLTLNLLILYNFFTLPLTPFEIRRALFQSFILSFLFTFMLCIKSIPKFFKHITSIAKVSGLSREWKKSAVKQVSNMLIFNILASLDFIIAGFVGKNSAGLGLYNIALTITSILYLIPGAVFQYLSPQLEVNIHHETRVQMLQDYWNKTLLLNFILLVMTSLLVNAYIDPILNFFGPEYIPARPLIKIILVGNTLSAMFGCPGMVLQYSGHVSKVLFNYASGIVIMILLALILSSYYGLVGVAIAKVLAWLCVDVRNVLCVRKHLKLKPLGYL